MSRDSKDDADYCSFCGKPRTEVKRIVSGVSRVGICDECSVIVSEIINVPDTLEEGDDDDVELR